MVGAVRDLEKMQARRWQEGEGATWHLFFFFFEIEEHGLAWTSNFRRLMGSLLVGLLAGRSLGFYHICHHHCLLQDCHPPNWVPVVAILFMAS